MDRFRCITCDKQVFKKDRFEKNFPIIETDSQGKEFRKIVTAMACSSDCLHMWYNTQNKWIEKEDSLEVKGRMIGHGGF